MTMTGSDHQPIRFLGLDLARYVAFVGMVIVNFKIAMGAEGDTGPLNGLTALLEGRAAATFVVLAGVGLGMAGASGLDKTVATTLKRALFLLALGLLNMTIFDADILHFYAFYFLFGVCLLGLSSCVLAFLALVLSFGFVIMAFVLDYDTGWNWTDYTYVDFWSPAGFVRNLFFNGWHPVVPWTAFLIFGIILSRLPLGERGTQWRLMAFGTLAVLSAEGISALMMPKLSLIDGQLALLATTDPIPPMPLYVLAGLGAASVVIGACLWLAGRQVAAGLLRGVVPAGRQTLSLYIAHILIGMGLLEALGLLGGQTAARALLAAGLFCAFATVFAFYWSKAFRRGPIESLMRRIAG